MTHLTIPRTYWDDLLELSKIELGGLIRALIQYERHPELYQNALPAAPQSVHVLLAELVAEQPLTSTATERGEQAPLP